MPQSYFEILPAFQQFENGNGDPLSGGKVYTYTAGTSSNKTTYREADGITANANPIILDSEGRCPYGVWGTTGAYKVALYTSADVLVRTRDNVYGVNDITTVGWKLLSSQTASNSAQIDFTQISATYSVYRIEVYGVVPATDNVSFLMRTSANGGSTYDSGGTDYQYGTAYASSGGVASAGGSTGASSIIFTTAAGNTTGEHLNMTVTLAGLSTAVYKTVHFQGGLYSATPTYFGFSGAGMRVSTSAVNAVRFLMSSGNISTGTFKLFGLLE